MQGNYLDLLVFGCDSPDATSYPGYSKDYVHSFTAVLNQSFRFAVFPKKLITFNPMQYVVIHRKNDQADLFGDDIETDDGHSITHEQFLSLISFLEKKNNPASFVHYESVIKRRSP